jgi:hypothetical protein
VLTGQAGESSSNDTLRMTPRETDGSRLGSSGNRRFATARRDPKDDAYVPVLNLYQLLDRLHRWEEDVEASSTRVGSERLPV